MGFIADVFDVTLIDNKTGEVMATTTLQDASIEVAVNENEVRGGKGNSLLATLHVGRDITIPMTDVEFRYDWLAKQLGTDVKTGAGIAYAIAKWHKLDSGLSITLEKTPLSIDTLAIYDKDGVRIPKEEYTLANQEVTFTSADLAPGDEVEVRTYQFATDASTQTIEFDSKKFAGGVTAILETFEIDSDEQITHVLQYQFDSAIPAGNFTISTASERNAATQEFNLKVVKPRTSDVVGRLVRFPYED